MNHGCPKKELRASVDLGIAMLHARVKRGVELPCDVIAVWAGCSRQRISQIEHEARRVVRQKLQEIL